jgi:tRNA threonylcarbamoyladenosine biosynthesis protein TsaB
VTILGIDTATSSTAVALLTADGTLIEARDDVLAGTRGHHTERVLSLAADLLERAKTGWEGLNTIAVGLGPGGYTGLRIGIATALGIARSHGTRLVGISSLRALAEPVTDATALTVLDARRGELFIAAYDDGVELLAPSVWSPSRLGELEVAAATRPLLALGDGAVAYRSALEALGIGVAPAGSVLHRVSAGAICRLAAAVSDDRDAPVVPQYLRLPDAEIALRAATS